MDAIADTVCGSLSITVSPAYWRVTFDLPP